MNCIDNPTLKSKIEEAYRLHNILMIEQYVKYITDDESYAFVDDKQLDLMTFSNKMNEDIVINKKGHLVGSNKLKKPIESHCVNRLNKTNEMISSLLFE